MMPLRILPSGGPPPTRYYGDVISPPGLLGLLGGITGGVGGALVSK